MARIEFPVGLEGSEHLPQTRRSLQNCFNTGDKRIISRPGINQLHTTERVARGEPFEWNGSLYFVASQELLKLIFPIDVNAFTSIGTIAGNAVVETAIGFNEAVLIVKGGNGYTLSKGTILIDITSVTDSGGSANFVHAGLTPQIGDTVTISGFVTNTAYNITGLITASSPTSFQISSFAFDTNIAFGTNETGRYSNILNRIIDIDFVPSVSVTHINGRFVYIPEDGSPAFFSDVGAAGTIDPLSFFDAENLPDNNNAVFNLKETLYICGTDSIQPFVDEGRSPVPFVSIQRSRLLNGYIGGLLEYNNTFLFIGRETGQDVGIYSIAGGTAPKISNEFIDGILITYTETELTNAVSSRFKWRGFDIATFTLTNDSFGFFGGNWFLLDTVVDSNSVPWKGGFIGSFQNEYYSSVDDKLGVLAKINSDYGEPITYIIDLGFNHPEDESFTCQGVELGISQGFNTEVGSVAIFMSKDNVLYGPPLYRNLGTLGQYDARLIWNPPGGLGFYNPFMGIRLYSTENIDFSADHLVVYLG